MSKTLTAQSLRGFTGTETWFKHALVPGVRYTEGAQHVAQAGEAYWLLDEVATAQLLPKVHAEEFQSWKLAVTGDAAVLTCEDGNHNVVYTKEMTFTDFPLPEITLWFTDGVILLPGEY